MTIDTTIGTPARTALCLAPELAREIERWAAAGYPHETCGLLLGRLEGTLVAVHAVRRARNLNAARAHDRYDLDPVDQLAAEDEARERRLDVVGIWHSHPDHPARPSETDRAHAWSGWSYVIVSVSAGGARDLRSWRLVHDRFHEEEVLS